MVQVPEQLTHVQLMSVLNEISQGVQTGDTLEGSIEFTMSEDPDSMTWDVRATYRIGNMMGQGGMRMIGNVVDGSTREILCAGCGTTEDVALCDECKRELCSACAAVPRVHDHGLLT